MFKDQQISILPLQTSFVPEITKAPVARPIVSRHNRANGWSNSDTALTQPLSFSRRFDSSARMLGFDWNLGVNTLQNTMQPGKEYIDNVSGERAVVPVGPQHDVNSIFPRGGEVLGPMLRPVIEPVIDSFRLAANRAVGYVARQATSEVRGMQQSLSDVRLAAEVANWRADQQMAPVLDPWTTRLDKHNIEQRASMQGVNTMGVDLKTWVAMQEAIRARENALEGPMGRFLWAGFEAANHAFVDVGMGANALVEREVIGVWNLPSVMGARYLAEKTLDGTAANVAGNVLYHGVIRPAAWMWNAIPLRIKLAGGAGGTALVAGCLGKRVEPAVLPTITPPGMVETAPTDTMPVPTETPMAAPAETATPTVELATGGEYSAEVLAMIDSFRTALGTAAEQTQAIWSADANLRVDFDNGVPVAEIMVGSVQSGGEQYAPGTRVTLAVPGAAEPLLFYTLDGANSENFSEAVQADRLGGDIVTGMPAAFAGDKLVRVIDPITGKWTDVSSAVVGVDQFGQQRHYFVQDGGVVMSVGKVGIEEVGAIAGATSLINVEAGMVAMDKNGYPISVLPGFDASKPWFIDALEGVSIDLGGRMFLHESLGIDSIDVGIDVEGQYLDQWGTFLELARSAEAAEQNISGLDTSSLIAFMISVQKSENPLIPMPATLIDVSDGIGIGSLDSRGDVVNIRLPRPTFSGEGDSMRITASEGGTEIDAVVFEANSGLVNLPLWIKFNPDGAGFGLIVDSSEVGDGVASRVLVARRLGTYELVTKVEFIDLAINSEFTQGVRNALLGYPFAQLFEEVGGAGFANHTYRKSLLESLDGSNDFISVSSVQIKDNK